MNRELQGRQEAEPRRSAACCGASPVVCCGVVSSPEQASPRVSWGRPCPVALGPTRVAPPRLACAPLTCVARVWRASHVCGARAASPQRSSRVRERSTRRKRLTGCGGGARSSPPCPHSWSPRLRGGPRGRSWAGCSATPWPAPLPDGRAPGLRGLSAWAEPPQRPVARLRGPSGGSAPVSAAAARALSSHAEKFALF